MLNINNLSVCFDTPQGRIKVLDNLSYHLKKGEVLAIVGESGCGKTIHSLAITRLLPPGAKITSGSIIYKGKDIVKMSELQLREVRGAGIGMIFQDPMMSLNPVFKVAFHLTETLRAHSKISEKEALEKAASLLKKVGIDEKFLNSYPHQLSGGMRQRVMTALALCLNPDILIADEPTTALDVTVQRQILELIKKLQKEFSASVIFITHNLAIVNNIADRVLVLYAGEKVEECSKEDLFKKPLHPYSEGLLNSVVRLSQNRARLKTIEGAPPAAGREFKGCKFAKRCPYAQERCKNERPPIFNLAGGRLVKCWRYEDISNG